MKFLKLWEKIGIYGLTLFVFLVCWALLGENFVSTYNLMNVLMQICLVVIGSVGIVSVSYTHLGGMRRVSLAWSPITMSITSMSTICRAMWLR